jgi:hypothetical protein
MRTRRQASYCAVRGRRNWSAPGPSTEWNPRPRLRADGRPKPRKFAAKPNGLRRPHRPRLADPAASQVEILDANAVCFSRTHKHAQEPFLPLTRPDAPRMRRAPGTALAVRVQTTTSVSHAYGTPHASPREAQVPTFASRALNVLSRPAPKVGGRPLENERVAQRLAIRPDLSRAEILADCVRLNQRQRQHRSAPRNVASAPTHQDRGLLGAGAWDHFLKLGRLSSGVSTNRGSFPSGPPKGHEQDPHQEPGQIGVSRGRGDQHARQTRTYCSHSSLNSNVFHLDQPAEEYTCQPRCSRGQEWRCLHHGNRSSPGEPAWYQDAMPSHPKARQQPHNLESV